MKPGSELIAHAIRDLSKGLRRAPVKGREGPKIHRLVWTGGVLDCFRGWWIAHHAGDGFPPRIEYGAGSSRE